LTSTAPPFSGVLALLNVKWSIVRLPPAATSKKRNDPLERVTVALLPPIASALLIRGRPFAPNPRHCCPLPSACTYSR
jgi:hypothetical protein